MDFRFGLRQHVENRDRAILDAGGERRGARDISRMSRKWRSGCVALTSTSNFSAEMPLTILRRAASR